MRDYAVVANIKAEQKGIIDDVFDKGYEQGYHDGKLDGEAEKIEKLEKQFDDEKKAEYKRGYEQGRMSTLTIKDFEEIRRSQYDRGYKDACNDKDLITCKKSDELSDKAYKDGYNKGIHEVMTIDVFEGIKLAEYNKGYGAGYKDAYEVGKKDGQKAERMLIHEPLKKDLEEAYQKGLKHGQELRAEEVKCAEACGMKRAWKAVRKIIDMPLADLDELYPGWDVEHILEKLSAKEVIEKVEAWEKEQEENEKVDCNNTNCKNCINHNDCDYEDEWKLRRRGIVPAPPKEKQDASETNVESIAVWDEVEDNLGNRMVVTHIDNDGKYANADAINADGSFRCMPLEILEKTGRRFCFQELLNAMKKDDVEEADTNEDN